MGRRINKGGALVVDYSTVGLCTRCSGFYLLCYALILSKCPYYAQSLHPLCSLYAHYAASCLSDCMCFQFQAAGFKRQLLATSIAKKPSVRDWRKALLPEALSSAELESLLWDRLSLLRGKCTFPWEDSWRSYVFAQGPTLLEREVYP